MMNKEIVEQESYNIINSAIKNSTFIDFNKFWELHLQYKVKMMVFITTKGVSGKSTGWSNIIIKNIKENENFNATWIRNTKEELDSSDIYSSFNKALSVNNFDMEKWYVNRAGVFYKQGKRTTTERGRKFVAFADMNKVSKYASQNSLECDLIVYDEIINKDFNKPFLAYDLYTMIKTQQRRKNALVVLLANSHEADNDIINELGIEFDWTSGKTQIHYYEEKKLLAVYVQAYKNRQMTDADVDTDNLFKDSKIVQQFASGKVAINNTWCVKSTNMIKDFDNRFKPLWIFNVNDERQNMSFSVGLLDHKILYIQHLETQVEYKVPKLCYRPVDKLPDNTYVWDTQDYQTIKILLNNYNTGNLLFNKTYTRDIFIKVILPKLKMLLELENKPITIK